MNASRVRLLTCMVIPLLTACGPAPSEAMPMTYTCCEALDVDKPYQPGQTLTVDWTVESPEEPAGTPPQVELAALLTGPFATVGDLKAATEGGAPTVPGLVTFAAAPFRPSGMPDERPVSTIVIGPDAKPGYYNLVTSVVGDGNTTSGASIIRVVPMP
ncbi:hypothetical protein [Micromonospora sp. NPDC093277]|uniref:hypothetical protein n=1 Tax=Micromonospora sp. NPDC093277 TaxID=3364291 RepID=UPI003809C2BC